MHKCRSTYCGLQEHGPRWYAAAHVEYFELSLHGPFTEENTTGNIPGLLDLTNVVATQQGHYVWSNTLGIVRRTIRGHKSHNVGDDRRDGKIYVRYFNKFGI